MAFVPTRQFHPFFDSFHTSSNFHSLRFFTCTSRATRNCLSCLSISTLSSNSPFLALKNPIFPRKCFSSESWLKRWNQPSSKHTRPKPPRALLNYQGSDNGHSSKSNFASSDDDENVGGSTMDRIIEKLKNFGYDDDDENDKNEKNDHRTKEKFIEKGSVEDIFYVEEGMLPNTRGGFSPDSPFGVGSIGSGDNGEVRFPWEKPVMDEEVEERKPVRRKSRTSLAEMTLPESELRRLLKLTFQKKHKTRVGGGGVTQAVVEKIHERWKTSEIVRLKFEGDAALNMKRMHEMLEVCYFYLWLSSIFDKSCFYCLTCAIWEIQEILESRYIHHGISCLTYMKKVFYTSTLQNSLSKCWNNWFICSAISLVAEQCSQCTVLLKRERGKSCRRGN